MSIPVDVVIHFCEKYSHFLEDRDHVEVYFDNVDGEEEIHEMTNANCYTYGATIKHSSYEGVDYIVLLVTGD